MMYTGAAAVAAAWAMVLWTNVGRHTNETLAVPAVSVVEPLERVAEDVDRLRAEIAKGDLVMDEIDRATAGLAIEAVSMVCETTCSEDGRE